MRIGISVRSVYVNGKDAYILYKRYVTFFEGFEVILLLPNQSKEVLEMCDCFILTGGDDLNPKLYDEFNCDCKGVNDENDSLDFLIIEHAIKKEKKLLGICRGIQSINVFFGGSLCQNECGHMDVSHVIESVNQSQVLKFRKDFIVNSYHHQTIKKLGKNLRVLYKSVDGVVEMLEHINGKILGVQFHPEINIDKNSIEILKFIID